MNDTNTAPLSNFIRYKELVDSLSVDSEIEQLDKKINYIIQSIGDEYIDDLSPYSKLQKKTLDDLIELKTTLENTKNILSEQLTKRESRYFAKSYELYEDDIEFESSERLVEKIKEYSETPKKDLYLQLKNRISVLSDWKYPGMFIRPFDVELVDVFKANDPLYLIDQRREMFKNVQDNFNKIYQSRLRYSLVDDDDDIIFKKVPKKQLGLIFAHNFFDFKPLDVLKKYCKEMLELLRPGGTLIFTYNNCDLTNCVRNFENAVGSYTPGRLLVSMLTLLGYEIVHKFDDPNSNLNWIEVKKPGDLVSLRGGQSMSVIKHRSVLKPKGQ